MNPEQSEQHQQNTQNAEISHAFRIVLFMATWLFWVLFLLVPTLTGMHGTAFLDMTNSVVFVLIGLVFCTAQNNAIVQQDTLSMIIFCAGMTTLSIWF